MPDDILKEAIEEHGWCQDHWRDNHANYEEDIRFARLEEQWPDEIKRQRELEGRPCLTVNKLGPVIRQVVNDARQNKPQIKVLPQDSNADPETAEVMSGLIRNIEASSDADTAYDTAVGDAVAGGLGYFRVNLAYACDDSWDQDIVIERMTNPLAVLSDPYSTAADSSDWNLCFVTDRLSKKQFQRDYKGAQEVDWAASEWPTGWMDGEQVTLAEYWKREQVKRKIVLLSSGDVLGLKDFEERQEEYYLAGIEVMGDPREVMSYKVTQRIMSGVEVLKTVDWEGKYIPIIPVYGDEINLRGKRYFRSLIRSAVDAQRMFNYWNTTETELVALAPKAPFIGEQGAFDVDEKWATANTQSHAYLEFKKGMQMPQRQPFAGVPAGAFQAALNASDHIKAVTGIYDASLGAPGNEKSGRAIIARQKEGDVSTFHFIDNLSRAVRHGGRVLIDLIPKVYTTERVIRTLGVEGQADIVPLGQPVELRDKRGQPKTDETGNPVTKIYDLTMGKYDLTVSAGPSFTTRREEAAQQMVEFIRAFPQAAPLLGDMLAKNLDWPGADEIGERLKAMLPPQLQEGGQNPEQAAMMQEQQAQMQEMMGQFQQLQGAYEQLQKDQQLDYAKLALDERKIAIDEYKAETDRMTAIANATKPTQVKDAA